MRFYISLYLLVAALYLLTASGRLGLSDGIAMFNVSQSIVSERSLSSEPCQPDLPGHLSHCVPGRNGRYFAGFGLLPSVLAVPAILGAKLISGSVHIDPLLLTKVSVSMLTPLVAPIACVVLAMWMVKLGYSRRTAAVGALILAFASPYWHFGTKGFYSEPFFTLALLLAAYFLSCRELPYSSALSGLAFGLACACRINGLILFPIFLLALVLYGRARRSSLLSHLRDMAYFSVPFSVCMILIAWANYVRFGSPFKTGYHLAFPTISALFSTPLFKGIAGLLFSCEVGLIIFAPWVALAIACFPSFVHEHLPESVLCGMIFSFNFFFFAKYDSWHGGWVAGPRLLLPTLPFLIMTFAPIFERLQGSETGLPRRFSALRLIMAVLVMAGFLLQFVGVFYPDERYYALRMLYADKPSMPWGARSIPLASVKFLYGMNLAGAPPVRPSNQLVSDQANVVREEQRALASASTAISEEDFLRAFPNPENLLLPNLMLVKMRWLGLRAAVLYGYILIVVLMGLIGLIGLKRNAAPNYLHVSVP